jgi:hypothetical protein
MSRLRYIKRDTDAVVAVQFDLDSEGFTYQKWGGTQRCKRGDWLVDNAGDIYTIDRETFARTYRASARGTYVKVTPVWAEPATLAGELKTKEGTTHYQAGDYLVSNDEAGLDVYAVAKATFEQMYRRLD